MSLIDTNPSEPPLIPLVRQALKTVKRVTWLTTKLLAPRAYRALTWSLAAVLVVALNPAAGAQAASGADTPSLSDFSFTSYEDITPDDIELALQASGFVTKPTIVATEMGTPEKELRARREQERRQADALAARQATRKLTAQTRSSSPASTVTASNAGNSYAYGYCTWWAKSKRPDLPNQLGNAGRWLSSAQSSGLTTGHTPKAGAIVVTSESSIGHVGFVEAVEGSEIVVSDMNMIGWGKISKRRMSANASVIKGFIYYIDHTK